ncbi:MAG: hypothetical protein C6Y22_25770 [Hapalosiphonaceae cyanobacterium JJU2]|nr:MAG: hypothetical protein C6Y22_25770 [Hapalosiphonaceae cyanobacterium JJU2]
MDTKEDFQFLEESVARKHNPKFGQREYLVIQTYPIGKTIRVIYRSYDYQEAEQQCNLENLANDYCSFATRVYYDGKIWVPSVRTGIPYKISEQQFWEIHDYYKKVSNDLNIDGEIEIHDCSYPYFYSLKTDNLREYWQPLTCLKDDYGRDIDVCPNCGCNLVEYDYEDLEEDEDIPLACKGCSNYHGEFYEDTQLICGIHPYGWLNDGNCPDFEVIV